MKLTLENLLGFLQHCYEETSPAWNTAKQISKEKKMLLRNLELEVAYLGRLLKVEDHHVAIPEEASQEPD